MQTNLGEWIDEVREKPEHMRKRYVLLCVAISMVLIFGVWLLTVSESFKAVSSDTTDATKDAKNILPRPSNFSLDQFLKGNQNLGGAQPQNISGQQYYDSQSEQKSQPKFNDEGVAPVGDKNAPSNTSVTGQ